MKHSSRPLRWVLALFLGLAACHKDEPAASAPLPVPPPPPKVSAAPKPPDAPAPAPAAEPRQASSSPRPASHPGEPMNPAELKGVVERHFNTVGNTPSGWEEMIRAKTIRSYPLGKNGKPLDYIQYRQWAAENP